MHFKYLAQLDQELKDLTRLEAVQDSVISLMLKHLDGLQGTPLSWDKARFSTAVAALAMNTISSPSRARFWLELCIADLKSAILSVKPLDPDAAAGGDNNQADITALVAEIEVLLSRTRSQKANRS